MNIAIATSEAFAQLPEDEAFFVRALQAEGANVEAVVWTDENVKWSEFEACIVRSTWDFHRKLPAFLSWLDRVERDSICINSPDAIRWNSDKSYLLDLATRGVSIVPTEIVSEGHAAPIRALAARNGWDEYVIKPVVSASSFLTERFHPGANADPEEHLAAVLEHSAAIVQPYMRDVDRNGERSYVVIGGAITHAVRRAPFNGGARGIPQPRVAERRADTQLVMNTWCALPGNPLYARIDVIQNSQGKPMVAECELIEPALFFSLNADAAAAFARVALQHIREKLSSHELR